MSEGKDGTQSRRSIVRGLGGLLSRVPIGMSREESTDVAEDEVGVLRNMVATQTEQLNDVLKEKEKLEERLKRVEEKKTLSHEKIEDAEFVKSVYAENEMLKKKNQQIMDRVAFHNVDKMERMNRILKEDNQRYIEKLDRVESELEDISGKFEKKCADIEIREQRLHEVESKCSHLEKSLLAAEERIACLEAERSELIGKNESMTEKVEQFDEQIEKAKKSLLEEYKIDLELIRKEHNDVISKLESKLNTFEGERNALRKHIKSLQKDLKDLVRSSKHPDNSTAVGVESFLGDLEKENRRLTEEVARKNRSLADAIEALHVQMTESDEKSVNNLDFSMDKTKQQLVKENKVLRTLANDLSTDLKDKDIYIAELRRSMREMGEELLKSDVK